MRHFRSRFRFHRRAAVFWPGALALSLLTGLLVAGLVGRAEAAAARYGGLQEVAVAAHPVPAGAVLRAADVHWERRPRSFLPASPPARSPVGHAVLSALVAGEVVIDARLAPQGLKGPAALVPQGSRALTMPPGPAAAPVQPGDHVDVLVTVEGSDPPTSVVATDALVVASGDAGVTVAVDAADAPAVAYALTHGAVTLALSGDVSAQAGGGNQDDPGAGDDAVHDEGGEAACPDQP
jgi:Flp pilus assembly protein CpaB